MLRRPSDGPPPTGAMPLSRTRHSQSSIPRPVPRSSHATGPSQNTPPTPNTSGPSRFPRLAGRVSPRNTSRPLHASAGSGAPIEQASNEIRAGISSALDGQILDTARSFGRSRNGISTESATGNRSDGTPSGLDCARGSNDDTCEVICNVTRHLGSALGMMSQFYEAIGIERQGRREADGHIAEKEEENKELRERISELEHELETSESRRDTISENLRERTEASNRLEQELDLCKKEKQSALDQQSQSQKMLKQLKAQLDEAQKRNNNLQMEAKLHEDETRVLSEQLSDETKTNTQLQKMVTKMQKACESSEAEKRDLREQLNTANRVKSDLDIEMTRARERSEAGMQKLQDQLSAAENKKAELEEKANAMRNERDEAGTMQQNAAEERRAAENETLSEEKQDLTARNILLQRKVLRVSVRLRTTQRLLTNERAISMKCQRQKKALCTALDKAKEEQTRLTIANRDLEVLIPTLQKDIKDPKDWVTAPQSALLDAEQQPSTSQDSPGATARPNNPRVRERKRNRQVGQIREGGRIYIGEWRSQVEANTILEIWSKQSLGHIYRRKNGRKGRWRR